MDSTMINAMFLKIASKPEMRRGQAEGNCTVGRFVCPHCEKNVAFLGWNKNEHTEEALENERAAAILDIAGIEWRPALTVQMDEAFTDSSAPGLRGNFVRVENWRRFNETWKAKEESRLAQSQSRRFRKSEDLQQFAESTSEKAERLLAMTDTKNAFGPNHLTKEDFRQGPIKINCCGRAFEIAPEQVSRWGKM